MAGKTYRAFLSYSHSDKKWARWLHHSLETYRVPKHLVGSDKAPGKIPDRLTPIFRDRDELPSSHDLSGHIKEALQNSENLILICSPRSARSQWVDQEVQIFKRLGRSARIFCIIVDGDPGATESEENCFPPALRTFYDEYGQPQPGEVEPIAADARKSGDGRSLALLKLISGLIGVGLDDLRQRELQRRNRRMVAITIASLAGLVVTAMLAISAFMARDEANHRREQAEDLLSFMVGDLRDSLEPIGRLDLLEQVGVKAMAYFATVKAANLTDKELSRHAQILTQLGEIRMSQRQYDNALTSFTEAFERSAELSRNSPRNGEHLFGRGQAEFWVGYVHWRRGDFESARNWLTRYRDSSAQLSELDSARVDWAREVAYGDHNLAVLELEAGDLEAAEAGFRGELNTLIALQALDPELELRREIADIFSWLGNIALQKGELIEARQYYERASADLETLLQEAPDDASRKDDWVYSIQWIAEIAVATGDLDRASALVDEAIAVFDSLVAQDKTNREWLRASTRSWILKGTLLTSRGEWDDARLYIDRSVALLQLMIAEEASDLIAREQLADAFHLLSWIEQSTGNEPAAELSNQMALSHLNDIQHVVRLNDDRLGKLGSILLLQGQLLAAKGESVDAHRVWQKVQELLEERVGAARSPQLLDPWLRVLILLGQAEQATQVRAQLDASQYQPIRPWPEWAD